MGQKPAYLARVISLPALALILCLSLSGCAELLPIAGAAFGFGFDYANQNCPERTFTCQMTDVHKGVMDALADMSLEVTGDQETEKGRTVEAVGDNLKVKVKLARVTDTATKVDVNANKNPVIRDGATAHEIIEQVALALQRDGLLDEPIGRGDGKDPS